MVNQVLQLQIVEAMKVFVAPDFELCNVGKHGHDTIAVASSIEKGQ
jgi:hypothetical protein